MQRKLMAGLVIIAIGVIFGIASAQYKIGLLSRMGPGYFPLIISIGLVLLGLIVCFGPVIEENKVSLLESCLRFARPWLFIIASVLVFILAAKWAGFVIASFFCVFIASFADKHSTFKGSFLLAAIATIFTVIVFYFGVRIQIPLFIY